jgi:hypothetical protein
MNVLWRAPMELCIYDRYCDIKDIYDRYCDILVILAVKGAFMLIILIIWI